MRGGMILEGFIGIFVLSLVAQDAPPPPAVDDLDYGEVFLETKDAYKLPLVSLNLGYSNDLNNTFLDLQGISGGAQVRVWKYISTGVFGQYVFNELSQTGKELQSLSQVEILFNTKVPRWGVYSLSYLHLMLGKWNVLNLGSIQVDFLVGGGAGVLNRKKSLNGGAENIFSHIWSIEQRVAFPKFSSGAFVSFYGTAGGTYIQPGLFASF